MRQKEHLPMCGVGPIYGSCIILLTVVGIWLSVSGILTSGQFSYLQIPFAVIGVCLIVLGAFLWYSAVFQAKVDEHIKNNTLATTGVYAWVRNPIYSAFLLFCTGALLIANNLWLLVLPPVFWLFLTVLMKHTEEKWLEELHGQEYRDYCKRANRCIPWFAKK